MIRNRIKKLELHLVRLEQAIRQAQRMRQMGVSQEKVDEMVNEYLDQFSEAQKEIEELRKQIKEDKG